MRERMLMGVMVAAILFTWTSGASALTVSRGIGTSANDIMYVGMCDPKGDGTHTYVVCFCFSGSLGYTPGVTSLQDDYEIHGDSADTSTGADTMIVVGSNTTLPGNCSNTGAGGPVDNATWSNLAYNGHYLDFYGDGGNDTELYDGGGSHNTWLHGGAGNDFVVQASTVGSARGDDGNDFVEGITGGSSDVLQGGNGDDCLYDSNNSWSTFDCGPGTDTYQSTDTATKTACETSGNCLL